MATRSNRSKQTSRIILVIAGLLVLTSMGYFAYQYFSEREVSKEKSVQIERLNNEVFDLEERIYEYEVILDDRKLTLVAKNQELEEKKQDLARLAAQLQEAKQKDKANLAQIKQLEQRVNILARLVEQYEEDIEELREKNEMLAGQVENLQENETRLQNQNQSLQQQKDAALQELQETQELAEVLKTKDFKFYNLRRNKAIQDSVFRRWGMKDLRVCLTIIENPLAQSGPRDIYLVYEGPDAKIYQPENGGGSFAYGGQMREYTLRQEINYQNRSQEICFDFEAPENFKYEKGPHYLSVFSDEVLIGQGSFRVK